MEFKNLSQENLNELAIAQRIAFEIAQDRPDRLCSSVDVRRELLKRDYHLRHWKEIAGAVFKGSGWEYAGTIFSEHEEGHRRRVCVWHLKSEARKKEPPITPKRLEKAAQIDMGFGFGAKEVNPWD